MLTFEQKLQRFVDRLQKDQTEQHNTQYRKIYPNYQYADVWKSSPPGAKFVRVYYDTGVQHLARYFVRREDGAIFATADWSTPNKRRYFGTLDTIDQFYWGHYEGVAKPESQFEMKTTRHYQTAVLKATK